MSATRTIDVYASKLLSNAVAKQRVPARFHAEILHNNSTIVTTYM